MDRSLRTSIPPFPHRRAAQSRSRGICCILAILISLLFVPNLVAQPRNPAAAVSTGTGMYMSAFENGSVCSAGPGQTISTAVEVALPFGECRTLPPVSPSAFYYKFALTASEWLSAALTASPGSVYRLDLYDPQLSLKKSSLSVQSGQTNLSLTVDSTGEWVLGVVNQSDQTTYDIQINAAFPPSSPG